MNIDNTVLLVLDIQEKLYPAMDNKEQLLNKIRILIEGINELNIPVIYTEQYPQGLGQTVTEIKTLLENNNSKGFTKREFSAFPILKEELYNLKKNEKTNVILVGIETHVCVYQTVRDLISDGFKIYVPFDAVSSRNKLNHSNGLELLDRLGACITNVETVLFDLIKTSEHSSFKTISKLIR